MTVAIGITISPESQAVIERHRNWPTDVMRAINTALQMTLVDMENTLKIDYLSGQYPSAGGGSAPLAVRSGTLRQAATHQLDAPPYSGYIGIASGPASAYARVQLGAEPTTIRPKNAKHLWIPIGENLNPSGGMRMTPREAFEQVTEKGKKLLRIFWSKRGNLVAFLKSPDGGKFKRGAKKGLEKGKLLFVLKDQITVQGTDALANAVLDRRDALAVNLNSELGKVFLA